jgi:L-fucose mutarotase
MLKGLDPFLGPRQPATGQRKRIMRVDARFRSSVPVTHPDGICAVHALKAALSVLPWSNVVAEVVWPMAGVGDAAPKPTMFAEFQYPIARRARPPLRVLERSAFYNSAGKAFAMIATGGRWLCHSVLTKQGVIPLDEAVR